MCGPAARSPPDTGDPRFRLRSTARASGPRSPAPSRCRGDGRLRETIESTACRAVVPAAGGGLGELAQCPGRDEQPGVSSLASLAAGSASSIAAETVEEDRASPNVRIGPRSPGRRLWRPWIVGIDQARGVGLAAPQGRRARGRRRARPGRPVASVTLRPRRSAMPRSPNSPPNARAWASTLTLTASTASAPDVAGELDLARGNRDAGLVVPHHHGGRSGQPPPAEHFLDRDLLARKACRRPLEDGRRGGAAIGERQRESVQQQIGRALRAGRSWPGQGFAGDVGAGSPVLARRPANSAALQASR